MTEKGKNTETAYQQMLLRIKENIHEVEPEAEVWLYGSRARRDARSDSDWDVLVLSSKPHLTFREEEAFMDHICDLMIETGQAIQLFAYGKEEWHKRHYFTPFYKSVQSDSIRLSSCSKLNAT